MCHPVVNPAGTLCHGTVCLLLCCHVLGSEQDGGRVVNCYV